MQNVVESERLEEIYHAEKYGEFNDAPPGWHEISEKKFSQSMFFIYSPEKIEYRQIQTKDKMISAHLFFFHDGTGVAMESDSWKGKIYYYAFGCDHEYSETTIGNCLHKIKCSKCGHEEIVDSSG